MMGLNSDSSSCIKRTLPTQIECAGKENFGILGAREESKHIMDNFYLDNRTFLLLTTTVLFLSFFDLLLLSTEREEMLE